MNTKDYSKAITIRTTQDEYNRLDRFSNETGVAKSHLLRVGVTRLMNEMDRNNISQFMTEMNL